MAQAEEEEPGLFLAHDFLELETEESKGKAQASTFWTAPTVVILHIDEPRAQAFLSTGSSEDKLDGWYLDSGASHHMAGRREIFSNLNCNVRGSVWFGDPSVVALAPSCSRPGPTSTRYCMASTSFRCCTTRSSVSGS